nr:MAG TPA: hypothetical protein [Caudoviricetes sp.]
MKIKYPRINVKPFIHACKVGMAKNAPTILTMTGITAMASSTYWAVKATPKALALKERAEVEKNKKAGTFKNQKLHYYDEKEGAFVDGFQNWVPLTKLEIVQTCWRCYTPAFITGMLGAACLIGANSMNLRKNAALAAAYALSETNFKEYREKTLEEVGEKKEEKIRNAVAEEKITKNPVNSSTVLETGNGDTLCYDTICGRYFKSSIEKLKSALNELNMELVQDGYVSLNQYYDLIGLPDGMLGDDLGWSINDNHSTVQLDLSAQLTKDEAQTPCMVVAFKYGPIYNYDAF